MRVCAFESKSAHKRFSPAPYLPLGCRTGEETLTNHPKLIARFAPLFKTTPHFDSFISALQESLPS